MGGEGGRQEGGGGLLPVPGRQDAQEDQRPPGAGSPTSVVVELVPVTTLLLSRAPHPC